MKHQAGVTLISLLIGLVIAMLCMIAVLTTYRTVAKTGAESRVASSHDTQLQMGLTNAQMLLQSASFGLEGNTHFNANATIRVQSDGKTQSIKAIVWRYQDDNEVVCQGLADLEHPNHKQRQFALLKGTTDGSHCDTTQNLSNLTWTVQSSLANLQDYSLDQSNPVQITWLQSSAPCTPYGSGKIDESTAHAVITLSAKTSTQHSANLSPVNVAVCLLNISTS